MISDKVLAMCELMNDLLYQKIPESRHGYYVNQSLSIGYHIRLLFFPDCQAQGVSFIMRMGRLF